MSEATEKDEKTTDNGPGLFTMFLVAVAASTTVHFVIKGFERRQPAPAMPPADDWDFGA